MSNDRDRVSLASLKTWDADPYAISNYEFSEDAGITRITINDAINRKISIWNGKFSQIKTDIILCSLSEPAKFADQLYPDVLSYQPFDFLPGAISKLSNMKTSEIRVIELSNLASKHLAVALTPRFNHRFVSAAENSLYNIYRNFLTICVESGIRTICIPLIHTQRRTFPVNFGIHIVLRTIRRFLEKHGTHIDRIVLNVFDVYREALIYLMPAYFPRDSAEQIFSNQELPAHIGNEDGQPVDPERVITIKAHPFDIAGGEESSSEVEEQRDHDGRDDAITTQKWPSGVAVYHSAPSIDEMAMDANEAATAQPHLASSELLIGGSAVAVASSSSPPPPPQTSSSTSSSNQQKNQHQNYPRNYNPKQHHHKQHHHHQDTSQQSSTSATTNHSTPTSYGLADIRALSKVQYESPEHLRQMMRLDAKQTHQHNHANQQLPYSHNHSQYGHKEWAGGAANHSTARTNPANQAEAAATAAALQNRVAIARRYDRYLRQSRTLDTSRVSNTRCFYRCGTDMQSRPIMMVIEKHLYPELIEFDKTLALIYLIGLLDSQVKASSSATACASGLSDNTHTTNTPQTEFCIVYFHTEAPARNQPSAAFMREVAALLTPRYAHRLHALFMVHAGVMQRLRTWYTAQFAWPAHLRRKLVQLANLRELFRAVNPAQIDLPDFIYEYDRRVDNARGNNNIPDNMHNNKIISNSNNISE